MQERDKTLLGTYALLSGRKSVEVKRLADRVKCSDCFYSALCLPTSVEGVSKHLRLFICPVCKNLYAILLAEKKDIVRKVPLPGCFALLSVASRHACSETCIYALQRDSTIWVSQCAYNVSEHKDKKER